MQKTLIVISTPLQFLNALAYTKQINNPFKIIVLTSSIVNIKQIKEIDKSNLCNYPLLGFKWIKWDEIQWFIKLFYIVLFITISKYNRVVIGNYNNIIGYYLSLLFQTRNKPVILLDDGLATVNIYRNRNSLNNRNNSHLFGGRILVLFHRYFLNRVSLKSVTFYTSYNLSLICNAEFDKVIKQKIKSIEKKNSNEVWFIGSPLIENNYIKEDVFYEHLERVKIIYERKGYNFMYILHRFEKSKKNMNCLRFDLPIEVKLGSLDVVPNEIISFYSSALINIANLFPNIICSYINLFKQNPKLENLKMVYLLFEADENLKEFI